MTRKLLSILFIALLGFTGTCMATESGNGVKADACKNVTILSLRANVPIPPAKIVSRRDVNGVCEVILSIRGEFVPVYVGKNYVIAGEMFQDRHQVTQAQLEKLKAERFLGLKPEVQRCVAMTLKPPAGKAVKHTVYMITDPVCPFCHRAESTLKELSSKYGAEFKMVFYSVHLPVGRQKAIEAVCRGLSAEDYLEGSWKKDNKQYQCAKGTELIKRSERLARKLGVRGVPVFYLANGERVVGANIPALARALSEASRKATKVSHAR